MGSEDPERLVAYCRAQPEVRRVVHSGPASATMLVSEGLSVSLAAVRPQQFAAALLLRTGRDSHVAALRQRAEGHGWRGRGGCRSR